MSMLAEPKRRQKWSLNPRGKFWTEDSNKFGQKLLEKMGWTQGKGLGAKEDGMLEHVKVSHKNDSKGIGYKETDDQWTEHESNFSALLESLSEGEKKTDEIKLNSLEEKSQNSRARVHYKKFTRGKDLSKYSEKDLANIFGKKSLTELKVAKQEQKVLGQQNSEMYDKNEKGYEKSKYFSNGGLISDYFKKKLPNFGMSNGYIVGNNGVLKQCESSDSESEKRPSFGLGFTPGTLKTENKEEEANDVSNKKQSKIRSTFTSYIYDNGNEETPDKKRNKKKRNLEAENFEETPSKKQKLDASEAHESTPNKKKKDKSKKKQQSEHQNGLSNPAFDPLFSPVKVQKHALEPIKESCSESLNGTLNDTVGQVAENFEVSVQINNENTPVKKSNEQNKIDNGSKKKKKKKNDMTTNIDTSLYHEERINGRSVESKKKKKKDVTENMETSLQDDNNDGSSIESKKKKKENVDSCQNVDVSINEESKMSNFRNASNKSSKTNKKKSKNIVHTIHENLEDLDTIKKERTEGEGLDNPLFNMSIENEESINQSQSDENPYEIKIKEKKKKKKSRDEKETIGLENPTFNGDDSGDSQVFINGEFEVKRKDKSKKKKKDKKDKEDNKGLDNPALNINDSVEESCDLILNTVTTPVVTKKDKNMADESLSIQRVDSVKRRKSVRFSDVTRERIIPNKEEVDQDTLDESRNIVEMEGKLNDSVDAAYNMGNFIPKKKMKKRKLGLDNSAFDKQASTIEENINSICNTLDTYQAEIENDMNEAKIKTVEIEDMMVGEVGNCDGSNEVLADGTVKLKFKNAKFSKTPKYIDALTGAKKSYKHLIKGDIIMNFKETNLHQIEGYAVKAT